MNALKISLFTALILSCSAFNTQAEDISICQVKKTKAIRFALTCKKTENKLILATAVAAGTTAGTLDNKVNNLTDRVSTLDSEVNTLLGIPALNPVRVFSNDILKATVVGISKIVDKSTGQATLYASVQIQNTTQNTLYLALRYGVIASIVDNHGITSTCATTFYGSCGATSTAASLANNNNRNVFLAIGPGGLISLGFTMGQLSKALSDQLGSLYNLSFDMVHYLDGSLAVGGDTELVSIGFSGVPLSQ